MKSRNIWKLALLILLIGLGVLAFSYYDYFFHPLKYSYSKLYSAVKSKDIEAIKKQLSKKSIEFGMMAAERNNTMPREKVYENGFTATTFAEKLPPIRDERINGDMGAVEVWNSKEKRWEDLAFIKEDGAWKLAVGDMFAGTYQSPGESLDQREKLAANAEANTAMVPSPPESNAYANSPILVTNAAPTPKRDKKGK